MYLRDATNFCCSAEFQPEFAVSRNACFSLSKLAGIFLLRNPCILVSVETVWSVLSDVSIWVLDESLVMAI